MIPPRHAIDGEPRKSGAKRAPCRRLFARNMYAIVRAETLAGILCCLTQ